MYIIQAYGAKLRIQFSQTTSEYKSEKKKPNNIVNRIEIQAV